MWEGSEIWKDNEIIKKELFSKAVVGNEVWSPKFGWGTIQRIDSCMSFPIIVLFPQSNTKKTFKFDGKCTQSSSHPEIFWNSFDPPKEALVKPEKGWQWLYTLGGVMYLTAFHYPNREQAQSTVKDNVNILYKIPESLKIGDRNGNYKTESKCVGGSSPRSDEYFEMDRTSR